jgi:AbrB family looped-hinge helix DNA binding protein
MIPGYGRGRPRYVNARPRASGFGQARLRPQRVACIPYLFPYLWFVKAVLTSKGQITIPIKIRRRLRLEPGTVLDFDEDADHLRASVATASRPIKELIGFARAQLAGKTVAQLLEETRGAPEKLTRRSRR